MTINKIGIIANIEKEQSTKCALDLKDWAIKKGIAVFLEEGIARRVGADEGLDRRDLASQVDLLVVLGGDGTILRTVRFVSGYDKDAGTAMHKAASRFAIEAQNVGVTRELKPALAALGEVMSACVGCHAGYRIK